MNRDQEEIRDALSSIAELPDRDFTIDELEQLLGKLKPLLAAAADELLSPFVTAAVKRLAALTLNTRNRILNGVSKLESRGLSRLPFRMLASVLDRLSRLIDGFSRIGTAVLADPTAIQRVDAPTLDSLLPGSFTPQEAALALRMQSWTLRFPIPPMLIRTEPAGAPMAFYLPLASMAILPSRELAPLRGPRGDAFLGTPTRPVDSPDEAPFIDVRRCAVLLLPDDAARSLMELPPPEPSVVYWLPGTLQATTSNVMAYRGELFLNASLRVHLTAVGPRLQGKLEGWDYLTDQRYV